MVNDKNKDIINIDGRPAIETDEPMSIQEANLWALEQRDKADTQKAVIERLRCEAAKRRERTPTNPLQTLKPDPSYIVREFNAEADAFNVESSDGKKLLGKSLSNGNVRNGQKVRSFFAPNGQLVIDVKPRGRDIIIPKPDPKVPVEDADIWPCTVAFLYSRIKSNTEDLTDNGATDITSYDYYQSVYIGTTSAEGYVQCFDELGDYETASKALTNDYKDNRKLKPGQGGSGSAGDNAAWGSGSADAVRVWFYIGDPANLASVATTNKIIEVKGPPLHPSSGTIKDSGPGYCLVINSGFISSAIFPDELIGDGPLTKELSKSFPGLGGRIGYWGGIARWGGEIDYAFGVSYFRHAPSGNETFQTPTSLPGSYIPGTSENPWFQTNSDWFKFGWGTTENPMYIGCIVSSHVNVETSFMDGLSCGEAIPSESWFWGGDTAPYAATIDRYRAGWNGYNNLMYVCWEGHKDNIGLAQTFFEAFRFYWGLPGTVTRLATCGRYGCPIGDPDGGGGGGYPPPPPGPPRFIIKSFGRKAEIWLKVCRQNDPPLEIKLPFEFAAIVEKLQILGGATFSSNGSNNIINTFLTANSVNFRLHSIVETPHATLSIDKEFAYVNISYGAERIWEDPLTYPIKLRKEGNGVSRIVGEKPTQYNGIVDEYVFQSFGTNWQTEPRYEKDCFSYCQTYKIKLPTNEDKTLTLVESQRYKRGEIITLTANSPDTEFDQKFLIVDFKTERYENIPPPPGVPLTDEIARWTNPSPSHASFGGLPALIQFPFIGSYSVAAQRHIPVQYMPKFYKPQSVWTSLDRIHYQLQEQPRLFLPINEVLPPQVFVSLDTSSHPVDVIFDLDGKFGRGARAEKISHPSAFGNASSFSQGYTASGYLQYQYPLFLSFEQQLIGNGLLTNGKLTNWYRIADSSFPIMNQLKRNPPPD